jgi:gas vesicle protein GvpN
MKYKDKHQRKARGASIHKTKDEKMQEQADDELHIDPQAPFKGLKHLMELARPYAEKYAWPDQAHLAEQIKRAERERIEATYLVPKVDHFVERPDVKELSDRIKMWLNAGYPVHLIGPTGCGKTSLAMHTAMDLGRHVVWINGDESMATSDLIGGYSQIEQESIRDKYIHNVIKSNDILKADWIDNPLAIACKYGYTLVYNEFSRTKPSSNNVLLSIFEEGILELPTKFGEDRYVRVHPDFKAILTSNSIEYAGIHRPQDALLDRMATLYMDYYSPETEIDIVTEHTGLCRDDAARIVNVIRLMRERLPDAQKPGTRACVMIGHGLKALNGQGNINFEQLCIDVVAAKTSTYADLLEKQIMVKEIIKELS